MNGFYPLKSRTKDGKTSFWLNSFELSPRTCPSDILIRWPSGKEELCSIEWLEDDGFTVRFFHEGLQLKLHHSNLMSRIFFKIPPRHTFEA